MFPYVAVRQHDEPGTEMTSHKFSVQPTLPASCPTFLTLIYETQSETNLAMLFSAGPFVRNLFNIFGHQLNSFP
jgi:hypothetical protein